MAAAAKDVLLDSLVIPDGSGTAEDVAAVRDEVARLSEAILGFFAAEGVKVIACRGSVTDSEQSLRGKRPRSWPPGATWDIVPGTYLQNRKRVVVATVAGAGGRVVPATGQGHGSFNLAIHEAMHGHDIESGRRLSKSRKFKAARKADAGRLPQYLLQKGNAGLEETFAESAARHFGGDGAFAGDWPALASWWAGDPAASMPRSRGAGGGESALVETGPLGEAEFAEDGAIRLDLRAEEPGLAIGHALIVYRPGDEGYEAVSSHLAGGAEAALAPGGGTLLVQPFD